MAANFLPDREADLLVWSAHFLELITATPLVYSLSPAQATAYGVLHDSFATLYAASQADNTRTPSGIIAKDDAKAALIANARLLAGIVQRAPGTTNVMRSDLGLTVRSTDPTPIPAPTVSPFLDIVSMLGHTMKIRAHDGTGSRKKPNGVSGVTFFTFVGNEPPVDITEWVFEGNTKRSVVDIEFPAELAPGTKVFVTAFWRNPKDQSGPACSPISALIQYGGLPMAA